MKVLDLCCDNGHVFEGWFASEDDLREQTSSGVLRCPVCDALGVTRLPSAPRLNLAGDRGVSERPEPAPVERDAEGASAVSAESARQGAWMRMVRRLIEQTEDVGDRFAAEARRIHHGESPERGIRGQATAEDAQALKDEGIDVVTVPLPGGLKGPLH